jgi:hypothetical protein
MCSPDKFPVQKSATKQERLAKHYTSFIGLFHGQEDGLVEKWIHELVLQALLRDASVGHWCLAVIGVWQCLACGSCLWHGSDCYLSAWLTGCVHLDCR